MGDCLGLDIGGANIKLYHTAGRAISIPFAMWLRPNLLAKTLASLIMDLPRCDSWGVTMTGEMADVFYDRDEGVRSIVAQTMIAARQFEVAQVGFYGSTGELLNASQASARTNVIASANWHALALWVSSWVDRPSLLIDIGSTTTDLIPISPGIVATNSKSDYDRLRSHELVYVGIRRTPICGLVDALPNDDEMIPVVREVFATTDDCALLLGWVDEDLADTETCDRQPRTRKAAANRLARMIGGDHRTVTIKQAESMACYSMQIVKSELTLAAAKHHEHGLSQWIVSGHGLSLLEVPTLVTTIDLAAKLGKEVSRVAPAYAICELIRSGRLHIEPSS